MSRIVGIDLGTTNSLVAAVESGMPFVIPDEQGRRLTPSVVYFPHGEEAPVAGEKANRVRMAKPAETVFSVKRFMGRRGQDLSAEDLKVPYAVRSGKQGAARIELQGQQYAPEEISALVLKKLKGDAEAYFGEKIERAVITVPAYFNDAQRNATKSAGELAGFAVERILNEPTAAALAYGLNRLHECARVAVYDLGGGTFDLSILELKQGIFQVLSTSGNTRLGGDDLDRRLMEFLLKKISESGGPNVQSNPGAMAALRSAAEQAKIELSQSDATEIALPFLTPHYSFQYTLTREAFEAMTRDLITRTREHCIRALSDAKLEASELDQVILVGGQTRMPLVRQLVSEWFGCGDFEAVSGGLRLGSDYHRPSGPMLNTTQNPDEAVALGAAIQAEILSGGFKNLLLLDVTPLSLGIETFGGLMNVIIPRNSTIPVKAGELFTTAVDNQESMLIHVLQGERERAVDNWSLGQFTLNFEKAPRGAPRVGVQFEIDANGILRALARDTRTGQEKIVEMRSAVDVSDSDVQKMVEESVEHAFEDLAARRWVEGRLKAEELVKATRKGLDQFEAEIQPDESRRIHLALSELESIIAGSSNSEPGDLNALKKAHAELDEVTRTLAELMMDRAMEEMLRKRGLIS
jgi:molecular chaperone DnaK